MVSLEGNKSSGGWCGGARWDTSMNCKAERLVRSCPLVPHFPSHRIIALSLPDPETAKSPNDVFTVFLLAFSIWNSICFQASQNMNFNRGRKVKILLHSLQAGRGIQRRDRYSICCVVGVVCQPAVPRNSWSKNNPPICASGLGNCYKTHA